MSPNSVETTSSKETFFTNNKKATGNLHVYFTGNDLLLFLDDLKDWLDKYERENDMEITAYHSGVNFNKETKK